MKKRLLSFVLAICLIIPCAFVFSACSGKAVYTVSESEWELNFNITKVQNQHTLLNKRQSKQSLEQITSYTLSATGIDYQSREPLYGSGVLNVAPNGLDMEFYLDDVLQEEQTKTIPNTDKQYIGLKAMLTSYFLFSGKYNEFTFDENENAYVAEDLTVSVTNEDDINDVDNLYNKKVEVTFINGYLHTISVEFCDENFEAETVYQTFEFTFSDINNTIVVVE